MSDFVHLHCHTEYSLLDGAIRINDLVKKASDYKISATAITDHGNMHGAINFYLACKKYDIQPIIGCEVYVAKDYKDSVSEFSKTRHHLILLAEDFIGYQNLIKLVSKSYLDGFYYKPRVDKNLLLSHSEGIIALSACLAGEIPRTLLGNNKFIKDGGNFDDAILLANEYSSIYPNRFYLEVQSNTLPEQTTLNNKIFELAEHVNLPVVATNDSHYLDATDVEAHDILLCIQQQKTEDDPHRWRFEARDLYYKTPDEMKASFSSTPEVLENTLRIAERCKGLEIQIDAPPYHFPVYDLPEGRSSEEEFRLLARDGLKTRLEKHPNRDTLDIQIYEDRLEMEIKIICDMKFPSYFLIVQEFINWARSNNIPVGPGRGSAAGSLVAWALRITNIDPIPYKLVFERFLNVERISMPDIDIDFCEDRRLEVLDHVAQKYGEDKVAQIATFGKMKAKAVIRDVGRAMGIPFQETSRIAKMIPLDLEMTLSKALEKNKEFKKEYDTDDKSKRLINISLRLEGLTRHSSTHAAGVIISDKPMDNYLPLFKMKSKKGSDKKEEEKKSELISQYDMKAVEKCGLVKFDFLGLRTITLIYNAIENITRQGKIPPDLETLAFEDSFVYDIYTRGETDGIFQVESSGMRKYLRMLRPSTFEDIIAMLALYRPGPLNSGMVDEFCKRKHGQIEIDYILPQLEDCLRDTYGVIVYQEQVMQIAQIVGNYTLGGADILRRAMGKKNHTEMAMQRAIFIEGALTQNVDEKTATKIFDLMEKFAEYGFNKAHSAAYAVISYHTAYLKYYFKVEFMAALLSSEIGNQDKLLKYISVCRDMEIPVEAPDIQRSYMDFSPSGDKIVFGLGGIKNVGTEAINEIIKTRENNGEFLSFLDLCTRVSLRKVTKRVLEHLIKAGALDCFGVNRASLFACIDKVVAKATNKSKEKDAKQVSFMSLVPEFKEKDMGGIGLQSEEGNLPDWDDLTRQHNEKESLGFYLSSHPLQPYRQDIRRMNLQTLEELHDVKSKRSVEVAVIITAIKEIITKKKDRMAFVQVEDLTGHAEVLFFPRQYETVREILNKDTSSLFLLRGALDIEDEEEYDDEGEQIAGEIKIIGESLSYLNEECKNALNPIHINFPPNADILQLKSIIDKHLGNTPLQLSVNINNLTCLLALDERWSVVSSPDFHNDIEAWKKNARGLNE